MPSSYGKHRYVIKRERIRVRSCLVQIIESSMFKYVQHEKEMGQGLIMPNLYSKTFNV